MQFFAQLGDLIEQRWRSKNYDETLFPEIAAEALREMPVHEYTNEQEIIHWLHTTLSLPKQMDVEASFGNPPITLHVAPHFYIDAYYWLDGATTIHKHAFSGAFQVLSGSSIHSRYEFTQEQAITQHFAVGSVNFKEVELLKVGDTREIVAGDQFIHALFHLDRPSVTICVRTIQSINHLPQYNYLRPYFAKNPFFREELQTKKLQSLDMLLKLKHPEADKFICEVLQSADFQTVFLTLQIASYYLRHDTTQKLFQLSEGEERFQALMQRARQRHGQLIDFIPPVLDEMDRLEQIVQRRRFITSKEQRFFLALLLNIPERAKVLDLIQQRFPEQEVMETLDDWVMELANTKVFGYDEPNLLGIADFDEDYLFVLQQMMLGKTPEQIRQAILGQFAADYAEDFLRDLPTISERLQNSVLFKAILTDTASERTGEIALTAP
jgi:hypothetical protein